MGTFCIYIYVHIILDYEIFKLLNLKITLNLDPEPFV